MAEVLVTFAQPILSEDGTSFVARACGGEQPDGRWHGWVEFIAEGTGEALRSGRETTQPNHQDLVYWATGLTPVYLEGALHRASTPSAIRRAPQPALPIFDGPAPPSASPSAPATSVLDPFSVYRKGESLLRAQLAALSSRHLVNIVLDHGLSQQPRHALEQLGEGQLIELIVLGVMAATAPDT